MKPIRVCYGASEKVKMSIEEEIFHNIFLNKNEMFIISYHPLRLKDKLVVKTFNYHEYPLETAVENKADIQHYINDVKNILLFHYKMNKQIQLYCVDLFYLHKEGKEQYLEVIRQLIQSLSSCDLQITITIPSEMLPKELIETLLTQDMANNVVFQPCV